MKPNTHSKHQTEDCCTVNKMSNKLEQNKSISLTCMEPEEIVKSSMGFSFHHLRYVIVVMAGMSVGAMLFARHAFTTAMVSMVNHSALYELEHPNSSAKDFFRDDYVEVGQFVWSNEIQQMVLSGYMITYTLPQFFTTRWAMNYGLRKSVPTSLSICAISLILTPLVAHWGWQWVLVLRFMNGLGASPLLPIMINTIENWMPKGDSASGVAISQFACNLVYSGAPLISGFLAAIHWKWTFYTPAVFIFAFCFIWYCMVADTPKSSKLISRKELQMVLGANQHCSSDNEKKPEKSGSAKEDIAGSEFEWYFMFKIPQFYPLAVVWILQCSTSSGFVFLLPAYLTRILELPVEQIGYIHFISQIGALACMLWSGPMTRMIQSCFNTSLTFARNIVVICCSAVTVSTFAYLGLAHNHLVIVIALNRFFQMTNDTLYTAAVMDQFGHLNISCLVYSMSNTTGNLSTVLFCWASGKFLDYFGDSIGCWTGIMLTLAAMNVLFALVFICFCKSKPVYLKKPENQSGALPAAA